MKPILKGEKMENILYPKSLKALDLEIVRLTNQLACTPAVSEDYMKMSDNLKVVCEARSKLDRLSISTDMLLGIGANLLGLLLILNFERTGTITSKAISFLWKGKT
jgi:hypothetical protein